MKRLFELIKSLSKSEKRYFKVNNKSSKGRKKNYMRLMNAISRQEAYDEAKLLKKFKGEAFTRNFSVAKSDLYDLILRELRQYHSERSVLTRLSNQLIDIEVLFKKGLFEQCYRLVNKGIERAEAANNFLFKALFLQYEQRLMQVHKTNLEEATILNNANALSESLRIYDNMNEYWRVATLAYYYYKEYNLTGKKEDYNRWVAMREHPLMQDEAKAQSFGARMLFYNTKIFFAPLEEGIRHSLKYTEKMVDLFEQYPVLLQESLESYIIVLHNYISTLLYAEEWEDATAGIQKIRSIPRRFPKQKNKSTEVLIEKHATYLELALFNRSGVNVAYIRQQAAAFEAFVQEQAEEIGTVYFIKIYYHLAYAYFILEDYDSAQSCCYQIIQITGTAWRKDTFFINLMFLLIYFERQNINLQESVSRQLYRMLRSKDDFTAFEKILSRFVRKLPLASDQENLQKLYKETYADLNKMEAHQTLTVGLDDFDIKKWLEAKIAKQPFLSLIQK